MSDTQQSNFEPGFDSCDGVSELCPVELSIYGDYFTLAACVAFVAFHAILLLVQVPVGYSSKAWSFVGWLFIGTALELGGHAARLIMSDDPWNFGAFVVQLLFLILGPTCLGAALACTCKHIVTHYGAEHCILKPRLIPWLFVGSDFVAIVIQALGGALASRSTDDSEGGEDNMGDIADGLLTGGVAFSAATMIVEASVMLHFFYAYKKAQRASITRAKEAAAAAASPSERRFTLFCCSIAVGFLTIIVRCIYRLVRFLLVTLSSLRYELTRRLSQYPGDGQWMGFRVDAGRTYLPDPGWRVRPTVPLLREMSSQFGSDGPFRMIAIAAGSMTVFHPRWFFPQLGGRTSSFDSDSKKLHSSFISM